MIIESYANQWIISDEKEGKIRSKSTELPTTLPGIKSNRVCSQYWLWRLGWALQSRESGFGIMFDLRDSFSGRTTYFDVVLNTVKGDIPPF